MIRGLELVQAAIRNATLQRKKTRPKPLAPALAKKLSFAGGRGVPASLAAWLAYDTEWIDLAVARSGEIESEPIGAALDRRFDDMGPWDDFGLLLPDPVVLLPLGADSCHLLYLGKADEHGEYPVLVVDTDDTPFVTIYSPGFDVWIAEAWEALPGGWEREHYESMFDHPVYGKAVKAQAKANLHGLKSYDIQDPLPAKLRRKAKAAKKGAKGKKAAVEIPPEARRKIDTMLKRRKKQIDRTRGALEIAGRALGRLDDDVVAAVAKYIGEDPDFTWGVSCCVRIK